MGESHRHRRRSGESLSITGTRHGLRIVFSKSQTTFSPCGYASAWQTPQLRAMLYQFMSALAFSAVIEPAILFVAVYRMKQTQDACSIIRTVLLSFLAFDFFHSSATLAVVGFGFCTPDGRSGLATRRSVRGHQLLGASDLDVCSYILAARCWKGGSGTPRQTAMTDRRR